MKIALIYNQSQKTLEIVEKFKQSCLIRQLTFDQEHPDVVITIGGDGTLLHAVHKYAHLLDKVRFAGIHTGHLGFYTDWRDFEFDELLNHLSQDRGERVSYPLLEVQVTTVDGDKQTYLALNEATLRKGHGTLFCEVYVNQELFESFRGDGLCVSTPTGSTGLNKSLGGAIVHPSTEVMQLTEMASINNRVYRTLSSPMILAKTDMLQLKPHSDESMILSIDHLSYNANDIHELTLSISATRVSFIGYRHDHFWSRVDAAFIGTHQN